MNRLFEKSECIFAIALIVFFFLPWVTLGGFISFSGYNVPQAVNGLSELGKSFSDKESVSSAEQYILYALYLIPILCTIIIVLGIKGVKTRYLSLITGILPLAAAAYAVIKFGPIYEWASIGVYLTLPASIGLILSSFNVIQFKEKKAA